MQILEVYLGTRILIDPMSLVLETRKKRVILEDRILVPSACLLLLLTAINH